MVRELWKQIPGYQNYQVSNLGRIRRSSGGKGTLAGKIRKPTPLPTGYLYVDLFEQGVSSRLYVHQAVALAFKGPRPSPRHEVAHWDGKNWNNAPRNIRWATRRINCGDKIRHGTSLAGSKHNLAKLTETKVRRMRYLREQGWTLHKLADKYHVCMQNVDLICRRKTWRHVSSKGDPKRAAKACIA